MKVDQLWGRAFYANGLSFRLAKDPHFKADVAATASFGESYPGLPSVDRLRTTILEREKQFCRNGKLLPRVSSADRGNDYQ